MLNVSPRFGAALETLLTAKSDPTEFIGRKEETQEPDQVAAILDGLVAVTDQVNFREPRAADYDLQGGRGAVAINPEKSNSVRLVTRERRGSEGYANSAHELTYSAGREELTYGHSWLDTIYFIESGYRRVRQTETLRVQRAEIETWLAEARKDAKTKALPWHPKAVKAQARQEKSKVREMERLLAAFDKLARQAKGVQPQPKFCPAKA